MISFTSIPYNISISAQQPGYPYKRIKQNRNFTKQLRIHNLKLKNINKEIVILFIFYKNVNRPKNELLGNTFGNRIILKS